MAYGQDEGDSPALRRREPKGRGEAIPGSKGVDLGERSPLPDFPLLRQAKPEYGREVAFDGGRSRGMAADDMRAMFFVYLTVIAAGLVGFTLLGLLQR